MSTAAEAPASGAAERVRTGVLIVLAGAAIGVLSVGVVSRLAMFLLVRLNPAADGVVSDDDFEMGRFTLAGSLNLVALGLGLGLLSGLLYLAFERLRFGPAWFRTVSLSVGAGTVAAGQVIHADGVDFTLLEPLVLTVGLFVAIPVLHVALLDVAAVRIRAARGVPRASADGPVAWVLRAALLVLFVLVLASLVGDVRTLTR